MCVYGWIPSIIFHHLDIMVKFNLCGTTTPRAMIVGITKHVKRECRCNVGTHSVPARSGLDIGQIS